MAKTIFAAAKAKQYFNARLLDVTGSPQNEANVAQDDFEKRAAKAMIEGKTYHEEVVGEGRPGASAWPRSSPPSPRSAPPVTG